MRGIVVERGDERDVAGVAVRATDTLMRSRDDRLRLARETLAFAAELRRMSVWALVPAKAFERGKSRLAPALDDAARAAFARSLFDHVLGDADGVRRRRRRPRGHRLAGGGRGGARARRGGARAMRRGAATLAGVVDAGLAELAGARRDARRWC